MTVPPYSVADGNTNTSVGAWGVCRLEAVPLVGVAVRVGGFC